MKEHIGLLTMYLQADVLRQRRRADTFRGAVAPASQRASERHARRVCAAWRAAWRQPTSPIYVSGAAFGRRYARAGSLDSRHITEGSPRCGFLAALELFQAQSL